MADNYLERARDEFDRRRLKKQQQARLKWQRQLKAYKARIAANQQCPSEEKS